VIQNPEAASAASTATQPVLEQLQALTWVDHTALAVLLVFFVLGLFKGLIWQVSRVGILAVAYVVAGKFGRQVAELLAPSGNPAEPAADGSVETTLYVAYVLLFLAVLIVLSLLAMLLQKLAAKAGLSFFDRLGGGVLGVVTGAAVVLFGLFVVHMFFGNSQVALAAEQSHSLRWSRQAIDWLGDKVPDELRSVFELPPLRAPVLPGLPGEPAPGGQGR
jgi:membrane protein required for colicin V production